MNTLAQCALGLATFIAAPVLAAYYFAVSIAELVGGAR